MHNPINNDALDQIFRVARTHNKWSDKPVPETLIRAAYDLAKMGPTSANCSPARFLFLSSQAAKEKIKPFLLPNNVAKTLSAPWVAIIAYDTKFAELIPELYPVNPDAKNWFSDSQVSYETAFRNGSMQGAYLMLALRAMGLDCGPMSGFDNVGVDKTFFETSKNMQSWKSNWLCNIGYGDEAGLYPRGPRLDFDHAATIE